MQHPQRERLVDGDQHDDCGWQDAPDVQLEERQQIAGNQRDVWHGAKDQRRDQHPEGIAMARPRQCIAAERAYKQRDASDGNGNNQRVDGRPPEFIFDPCTFVASQCKSTTMLHLGAGAVDCVPKADT